MKLFGKMKIYIRKYIRKYIPVICSLFLIPLFSVNAFAYSATYPQYNYNLSNCAYRPWLENGTVGTVAYPGRVDADNNVYTMNYSHTSIADEYLFYDNNGSPNNDTWVIPYYPEYDYYFVASFYVWDQTNDFVINDFNLNYCINNNIIPHTISNKTIIPYSIDSRHGYTMFCKIDSFNENTGLYSNKFFYESSFTIFNTLQYYTASVFVVPKGDTQALDNITEAINNQTDIIENGNDDTSDIVSDFNEVFDDFNQELDNIEAFDSQIIGEFESANQQYMNELNNFSMSASLLNAGNWLSTSMQTVYDNSSDYKMLWLVPLLLGIPLIILFLKKGSDDE